MGYTLDGLTIFHKKWFADVPVNAKKASLSTNFSTPDSNLKFESVTPGLTGNDLTVTYADPGKANSALSAELADNNLVIYLKTNNTPIAAESVVGDITIKVDEAGADGNDYTVEVVAGEEVDGALDAELVEDVLTVTLGTLAANVQATTTIETATGGDPAPSISVSATAAGDYDGTAGNGIQVVFIDSGTGGRSASIDGGVITIDFGGEATITTANLATTISTITGISSSEVQAGVFTATDDVGVTTGELSGGLDAGDLDATKNTVTLVAGKINSKEGATFTASFDPEDANKVVGEDYIGTYKFSGGSGYSPVSTAAEILEAVEDIDGIDKVLTVELVSASGVGVVPFMEPTNFTGGQYATPCNASKAAIVIDDTIYITDKPVNKWTEDGWYSATLTKL